MISDLLEILFLLFVLILKLVNSDFLFLDDTLESGDKCHFNETLTGICTSRCQQLEDEYRNYQIFPKLCSLIDGTPIYCCPNINIRKNGQIKNEIECHEKLSTKRNLFYKEYDTCPYNETINGICRETCPDLQFPKYKLIITEKKMCPVKRGSPLECCINHLHVSYPNNIFNGKNIYNEGDFCPYNSTFIGICENYCNEPKTTLYQEGTFFRENPICNYQIDGTPMYCCTDYLYTSGKDTEFVPYASDGDLCAHQNSKWGACKPDCKKLKRYGIKPNICPSKNGADQLYCCPFLNETDELEKYRNASVGRVFYNKCQEFQAGQVIRIKRRIRNKLNLPSLTFAQGMISYGSFPHMAEIGWTKVDGRIDWKCDGALISEYFVLTVAHCVVTLNKVLPDVIRIGQINLDNSEDPDNLPQSFTIVEIIVHPDYNQFYPYDDIALIKLNKSIRLTSAVHPACLWSDNNDIDEELLLVAVGHGSRKPDSRNTRELLPISLKRLSQEECVRIYQNLTVQPKLEYGILDTQVCAADPYESRLQEACQGNSGGPLEYIINDIHYIYGISSFGQKCPSKIPGVYTIVSKYMDWIEAKIWSNIYVKSFF